MIDNPYLGTFIAFEGPDGSGQSTQVEKLAAYLTRLHKRNPKRFPPVHVTKEPSTGLYGGIIREALRERLRHGPRYGALAMQALFVADRAHHLDHEIVPLLEKGHTVITDRYAYSTIAYGAAESPDLWNCLVVMNETFIKPDLTILLDVSPEFCIRRMKRSRGHLELYEKEEVLKRVLANYRVLAKEDPRVFRVNGEKAVSDVYKQVLSLVRKNLPSLGKIEKPHL